MVNGFFSEQELIKYEGFDLGHSLPDRNTLALYAPSLNTFLMVDYRYQLLKKLCLIMMSKIRLEVINLSCNEVNFNNPILTNYNCMCFKPVNCYGFGPTLLTFKENINFSIEQQVYDEAITRKIKSLLRYLYFAKYIIKEYYFFFAEKSVAFNENYTISNINFLEKNLPQSQELKYVLQQNIKNIEKKLYFATLVESALFNAESKIGFIDIMKNNIVNEFDFLVKNHLIEVMVLTNYIIRSENGEVSLF